MNKQCLNLSTCLLCLNGIYSLNKTLPLIMGFCRKVCVYEDRETYSHVKFVLIGPGIFLF